MRVSVILFFSRDGSRYTSIFCLWLCPQPRPIVLSRISVQQLHLYYLAVIFGEQRQLAVQTGILVECVLRISRRIQINPCKEGRSITQSNILYLYV